MKPESLTRKQYRVLIFIDDFNRNAGYIPTYREIAEGLEDTTEGAVYRMVKSLRRKGYVERDYHKARGMRVVRLPGGVS